MKIIMPVVLAASVLGFTLPAAASQKEVDSYVRLAQTFSSPELRDKVYASLIENELPQMYAMDADIAEMETECPGVIDALVSATDPVMREMFDLDEAEISRRAAALFRANLTPGEADEVSRLYNSEVGQKILGLAATADVSDSFLANIMQSPDSDISREAIAQEEEKATSQIVRNLSAEDLFDIRLQFTASAAFKKFIALQPQIGEIRYQVDNAPISPDFEASLDEAVGEAVDSHLDNCYGELEE